MSTPRAAHLAYVEPDQGRHYHSGAASEMESGQAPPGRRRWRFTVSYQQVLALGIGLTVGGILAALGHENFAIAVVTGTFALLAPHREREK